MTAHTVESIGVVHTPWQTRSQAPSQGAEKQALCRVELDPAFAEGLNGLNPGDHLWVICHLERAEGLRLMVHPRGDRAKPLRGLFATRSPNRPGRVSLTLASLEKKEHNTLWVRGLDMVDGTPVLDIKPYVESIDRPRK